MTYQTGVFILHPMKNLIVLLSLIFGAAYANEAVEAMGERLFNDVRFSQYFFELSGGNVNYQLEELSTNQSKKLNSCASCHLVDQGFSDLGGMRGYNDFAVQTEIPLRVDGKQKTLRNTPTLVGIGSKYAQNRFSHYDGEFSDHSETVLGNFTGRNMGWLRTETSQATKNIVNILRLDNGLGELAQEFGGSYERVLLGIDPALPEEFRLPQEYRVDLRKVNDKEIINLVVKFVTAYLNGIDFEKTDDGIYTGSAYDKFLELNSLPVEPAQGQSVSDYTRELMQALVKLKKPKFVGSFYLETHKKEFKFQEQEWQGLRLFFNITKAKGLSTSRGMCLNCHTPPLFTDQQFHNIGVTQIEYDELHGEDAFMQLDVPELKLRNDQYFLDRAQIKDKSLADLGLWNFFARDGKSILTEYVRQSLCPRDPSQCSNEYLLPFTLGRIKTPTLRNLNHSEPYFHNGKAKTTLEVLDHYQNVSKLKRRGKLRNGANQMRMLNLSEQDKKDLAAFLETLNSDYD